MAEAKSESRPFDSKFKLRGRLCVTSTTTVSRGTMWPLGKTLNSDQVVRYVLGKVSFNGNFKILSSGSKGTDE